MNIGIRRTVLVALACSSALSLLVGCVNPAGVDLQTDSDPQIDPMQAQTTQAQTTQAQEMPQREMVEISADGAFSPQPGDRYEGGLNAAIPLFGVTAAPDDLVVAHVYDASISGYREVASTYTDGTAAMTMGGRRVYPYDLGMACLYQCDATIPLHAWAGFGPFVAHFRFWSQSQGWLDLAGECSEGDGQEPCATVEPILVPVFAEPKPREEPAQ